MSTHIFYKVNLPYNRDFQIASYYMIKHQKNNEYLFRRSFYTFPSLNLYMFSNSAKSNQYMHSNILYASFSLKVLRNYIQKEAI